MDNTISDDIINKLKLEANLHENEIEFKIKEGNEKLKNTLNRIKSEMEKISKKDSFKDPDKQATESSNGYSKGNINSNTNTSVKNSLPFSNKNDIQNDSALSSFHNHNINNRLRETTTKFPKNNINKNSTILHKDNILTDNMNSKENFFTKTEKNYEKIPLMTKLNNNIVTNDHLVNDYSQFGNYSNIGNNGNKNSINKKKQNQADDTEIENFNNLSKNSLRKKSDINFKFSGTNFHSKNSLSLNEEVDSNYEYSKLDSDKKVLELKNLGTSNKNISDNGNGYDNDYEKENNNDENLNQFSQSGTFKSKTNRDSFPYFQNDNNASYNNNTYQNKFHYNNSDILNSQQNTNQNFFTQHRRNYSESISEDINSIKFNYDNFSPETTARRHSSKRGSSNNFNANPNFYDSNQSNFGKKNLAEYGEIKKNLQSYLSDMESKNLVKFEKSKNQWIIKFNEDGDGYGGAVGYEEDMGRNEKENRNDLETSKKMNSGNSTRPIPKQKDNNFKRKQIDNKNSKRQNYIQLKNQIEIIKKEKESLEKIVREKDNETGYLSSKSKYTNNSLSSNHKSSEKEEKHTVLISSSNFNMSKLNSCKDAAMNNEELLEYENEVLDKIKKDDLFSQINNNNEDGLEVAIPV